MGKPTTARGSSPAPGIEIREHSKGKSLRVKFMWQGSQRRETLNIPVTPANIKYATNLRATVLNAIERGTFDYAATFPNSSYAKRCAPAPGRAVVKDLIKTYIDDGRDTGALSPSTVASYRRWANARLNPKWGERFADDLMTTELRAWVTGLIKEGMDNKSIRNCFGLLNAVLSRAAADSVIPANPLAPIKLKSVLPKKATKADDEDVDPFNDDEIALILGACSTIEEQALWQFAFSSGLRTGELIAFKDEHADIARGLLTVIDNVVSAETGTVEKDTKTGGVREIPMLPGARAAVLAMRSLNLDREGLMFVNPKTGRRWLDDQQLRKGSWIPILKRAGVRYRNPYQTRHTFASKLLEQGEQETLVALLLGHTSVEMVRRHYGRYIRQSGGIVLRGDYASFGQPAKSGATQGLKRAT